MTKLSAVVLTKNSESQVQRCLRSLKFVSEIIIIDDNSTDNTLKLAEKYTAKIHSRPLDDDFSGQRNYALDLVANDWVLFVDSDEEVPDKLAKEILSSINQNEEQNNGFFLKRKDVMWGKILNYGDNSTMLLRLGKKDKGVFTGSVHEIWNIKENVGVLKNPLYHYPHQSLVEFFSELNHYSKLRALELLKENHRVKWYEIPSYPVAKFFYLFIIKKGFLDGIEGFISAISMSFYSFFVRAKLWEMYEKRESKRD